MASKQFIAGVRCPQCQAEDRIRLCRDEAREWIECVACGYESENPGAPEHPQADPEAATETETGIVRFAPKPWRRRAPASGPAAAISPGASAGEAGD